VGQSIRFSRLRVVAFTHVEARQICRYVWLDSAARVGQSARMSGSHDSFNTLRAFAWGVVLIGDADTQEIPSPEPDKAIVSSDSAVVMLVRHAQDVVDLDDEAFLVEVQCTAGSTDRDDVSFDGDILISSGRLSIGDADHEDTLIVASGRWRLQIAAEPIQHPERVTVWFSPARTDSTH
jgi:hypothetical protein